MKSLLLLSLLLSSAYCYDQVYDMNDGNAIMTMNYLLTGILVPWIIAIVLCICSCVFCCVPKKYQPAPVFVQVPQAVAMVQQPMMVDPYAQQNMGYGQQGYGQQQGYGTQQGYGQQVMSPGQDPMMGQPVK